MVVGWLSWWDAMTSHLGRCWVLLAEGRMRVRFRRQHLQSKNGQRHQMAVFLRAVVWAILHLGETYISRTYCSELVPFRHCGFSLGGQEAVQLAHAMICDSAPVSAFTNQSDLRCTRPPSHLPHPARWLNYSSTWQRLFRTEVTKASALHREQAPMETLYGQFCG